jgi:hypothetical protein
MATVGDRGVPYVSEGWTRILDWGYEDGVVLRL